MNSIGSALKERKMRLIDADALMSELKVKRKYLDTSTVIGRGEYIALNKAITMLDEQPTVDAVPVVRCKDCRYWWEEERQCKGEMGFARHWEADDYCSNGERREE